jgi:hypothetical protein
MVGRLSGGSFLADSARVFRVVAGRRGNGLDDVEWRPAAVPAAVEAGLRVAVFAEGEDEPRVGGWAGAV